jgi:hypothetical protein
MVSSFLALNAIGGEINRPKAKGPHHHPYFLKTFSKRGINSQRGRNYSNCKNPLDS